MRKVELTMNEQKKYKIIKNLVDSKGNKQRAAVKLGCTVRNVDRLIKRYKQQGKAGFIHGNHKYKPVSTIPDEVKNQIILLYENKYFDSNIRHFNELLRRNEDIHIVVIVVIYYSCNTLIRNMV